MSHYYWIGGIHSVLAAINNKKRTIKEIWVNNEDKIKKLKIDHLFKKIKLKKNNEISNLFKSSNNEIHQGIAANISTIQYRSFNEILSEEQNTIVILDGVSDQRNIGSIIRCCVAFGVKTIIAEKKSLNVNSNTIHKASSGYIENIDIVISSNVTNNIITLKKKNYYIVGLDSNSGSNLNNFDIPKKHALIFGSEEKGIRNNLLNKCDFRLKIKMNKTANSLNVSNTVAIVLNKVFAS